MNNRATCICGSRKNFGVGGELDAQSVGPIFRTAKSGAIAPGGGEDNSTRILPAERRVPSLPTFRAQLGIPYNISNNLPGLQRSTRTVDMK